MKKLILKLFAVVMIISLLAGCGSKTGSDDTSSMTKSNHVENLIIGMTGDNNIFNMQMQSDSFGKMNYNGFTQGNFIYIDSNKEMKPYFFKSFDISEDGKQIVFTFPKTAV